MRKICLALFLPAILVAGCVPGLRRETDAHGITPPAATAWQVTWPGRKADGSVLLPNQWSLRPVGRQVQLADFPVNIAVHPGGRFAAVLHSGYSDHEILIVNLAAAKVRSRVKVHESFY